MHARKGAKSEKGEMRIEIYEDTQGEWRWSLLASNGRILADGAEGYETESSVKRAVKSLIAKLKHSVQGPSGLKTIKRPVSE
jgi:uncharacterized protein YegP (UPF0339 family)